MRKILLALVTLVSLSTPIFGAVKGAYHNHFAIELDYLLFKRSSPSHNKHLIRAAGGPINFHPSAEPPECAKERGKSFIDTKGLINDMHYDSGMGAAIKIFPSIWSTWEARYMGGFAWRGEKTRHCLENLNLDGPFAFETLDYNFASHVKTLYFSNMYTLELNYIRHITPRYTDHFSFSWIIGLRYFDINEKLKLYSTKTFPFVQTSRYRLRVENTLFGPQTGFCIEYNPYPFLSWGLLGKIGGLFNRDKQRMLMLDQNNTAVFRGGEKSGSTFAYTIQVYPFIEFRPTKHFFFEINYQALYVGNIATADRNMKFHGSGSTLNHEGYIVYHGLTGGIQFNF